MLSLLMGSFFSPAATYLEELCSVILFQLNLCHASQFKIFGKKTHLLKNSICKVEISSKEAFRTML